MVQSTSLILALAAFTGLMNASPIKPRADGEGKRGLAFPKQFNGQAGSQWTKYFAGSNKITWMYDWEAVIDGQGPSNLEYVPLLHSNQDWCVSGWVQNVENAQKNYNVKNILSFNEPDQNGGGGSNIPVATAVKAHKNLIDTPFAGKGLKIGSPSVTNGGEAHKGIAYLKDFISQCDALGCQIDFVVAHYYGTDNIDEFKNYLENFHAAFPMKPVWVTEFGVNPGKGDANAFLKKAMEFMDSKEWIHRYAYHMVAPDVEGKSYLVNSAGTGLSSTGSTFAYA